MITNKIVKLMDGESIWILTIDESKIRIFDEEIVTNNSSQCLYVTDIIFTSWYGTCLSHCQYQHTFRYAFHSLQK